MGRQAEGPKGGKRSKQLIAEYLAAKNDGSQVYKSSFAMDLDDMEKKPAGEMCGVLAQGFSHVLPDPETRKSYEKGTQETLTAEYESKTILGAILESMQQLLGCLAIEFEKPEYAGMKADDLFKDGGRVWKSAAKAAEEAMQQYQKHKKDLQDIQNSIAAGQALTIYRANNVATNDLLGDLIYTDRARGGLTHPTFTKNNKKANTIVRVSMKDRESIKTSRPVSEYDDAVSTAVNSLIIDRLQTGHTVAAMTLDQICRQLKGDLSGSQVSEVERAAVRDTINRLSNKEHLTVHINATEELRLRGIIGPNDVWNESGPPLVLVSEGTGMLGGHEVTRYVFAPSVLVLYSQMNSHETRLPVKALEIHDVDENGNLLEKRLSANSTRIQIINYLERRIAIMYSDEKNARALLRKYNSDRRKNQKKPPEGRENMPPKTVKDFRYMEKNRTILFDTMFRDLGITDHTERAKEFARKVLDNWKAEKIMQLKDYTLRKKAKSRADAIAEIEFWSR